ncbi:DUF3727 domain-containing protein [Planktothrix sp. FACHB-1355]|uniref:DUF3727 domain-containing protein n=1 Tax=Aerosakkonema funiforme FACHB-1375 TaxID=2949571 RepID=A0A926VFR1_9CYAN|nr:MULTISPECIES: DUF3727 domain-containing protein [Oscillatoriales]MBD2181739.1 DUF3727 domain-containing protein [Aerosakkonema funiforme FACHB-1375]MBD3562522.1 DUF3727 domain-containing protein [Planktothrix sp. FACHB-1355]
MSKQKENGYSQDEPVILKDEAGRELACYIERFLEVEGKEYVLLLPVDSPVEIFAWNEDFEDEEAATLIEDDESINKIFPTAQAVLAEQDLVLKHTAFSLTVAGELPEVDEEEILTLEIEDEISQQQPEELQFLASFYHEEQEYAIYTPLDPLLFFGRLTQGGKAELLSPEEFQRVQPMLEEQLFDELE